MKGNIDMNAISFGNPALYVKGIAERRYYDFTTGNIVGLDKVASEAAFTASANLQEITGGFGNPLVGVLPDSTRVTGTYTSQAFSLETRKLITGGDIAYNAPSPICETIVASGATLTVSKTPAKHLGQPASDTTCWCYVKPQGEATYSGTNYEVDPTTKQVLNFTATSGQTYEVFYFANNASAQSLAIPEQYNPSVVTVEIKYGVYANQNNSVSGGTLQGWLFVIAPRAICTGDAGLSANQTTNATTDGSWMAISSEEDGLSCTDCNGTGRNLAYYVYVPCGDATEDVQALAVPGGGISVVVNATKQIPVKYVMPNDSLVQPVYSDLTYNSAATATATVDANGVVTGKAAGSTTVTITLTKGDGTTLTTTCAVTVTAS